jgi:hypothetical protein
MIGGSQFAFANENSIWRIPQGVLLFVLAFEVDSIAQTIAELDAWGVAHEEVSFCMESFPFAYRLLPFFCLSCKLKQ